MITGRISVQGTILSAVDDVATLRIRASNGDIRRYLDRGISGGYFDEEVKSDQIFRAKIVDEIVNKANGMCNISIEGFKSDNCRFL